MVVSEPEKLQLQVVYTNLQNSNAITIAKPGNLKIPA